MWIQAGNFWPQPNPCQEIAGGLTQLFLGNALVIGKVVDNAISELPLNPHDRVQRVHGTLRDQGQFGKACLPHLVLGECCKVPIVESHTAPGNVTGWAGQSHQGHGQGRLARARLPNKCETLSLLQGERNVVYRFYGPVFRFVVDRQSFDHK